MEIYRQQPQSGELGTALDNLELALAGLATKDTIILSDFDYTLCDTYTYDSATNNHMAMIDPAVIDAAQTHHIVVATSRRVTNPTVPLLWSSGLVDPRTPVIAENGGALLYHTADGVTCIDLVAPERVQALQTLDNAIRRNITTLPGGQKLAIKQGRTLLIARLQDENGDAQPQHQAWLAKQLEQLIDNPELAVVDTRASVTIQSKEISKGRAFRHYLELANIQRSDVCVVGMGDGPNDQQIFEEADISLGFSDTVRPMVDIIVPHGPRAVPHVLQVIEESGRLSTSWRR